ncbi:MAG TPA: hypothetical protein VD967_01190 [Candidatus Paceibacterota bacterium]|nr:hypothetical protein [Candidatus Paceibacterota bacterium]
MTERHFIYALALLLAASASLNAYLWTDRRLHVSPPSLVSTTSSTVVPASPYGYRNEVVTVLENGKMNTYATTTPLTEKDIEQMQGLMRENLKAMEGYFRRQEQLFRDFWPL